MKSILVALLLTLATTSQATTLKQQLNCGPAEGIHHFTATLDYSSFTPASGFFDVTDAYIVEGYISATLQCVGNSLNNIDCVGFWLNTPGSIVRIQTQDQDGKITFSLTNLTAAPVEAQSGTPCTIK